MKPSQPGTSWALHPPFPVLHGRLAPAKAISEAAAHLILSNALPGGADVTSGRTVSEPKCSRAPRHPRLPRRSLPGQAPPPVTRESRIVSHGCCSQRQQLLPRGVGIAQGRRTGEVTWGNFGVGTANATARVEEEWVPYLFEGAWELLPSVPRALADQAREQGRNLLWLQGTQSIVKHEFSEEQFMAAHGTSHPPCQLHRACLVYITQDSKHLEDRWWVLGTDHPLPCYPLCPPPLSPLLAGGTRGAATATDLTAGSAAAPSPSVSAFAPVASGTAESHRESHRQEHVSLPLTLKGKRELIGAGAAEDQS